MTFKRLVVALVLALMFVSPAYAAPPSVQVVRTDDVLVKPGFNVEYSAVATPRSPACPHRRLIVDTFYYFYGIDMDQGGPAVWLQHALDYTGSPFGSPKDAFHLAYTRENGAPQNGDTSFVRLTNGDIILSKASNIKSSPGGNPLTRGFQRFWRSHDCGVTWEDFGFIDAASALGLNPVNKCSLPRWHDDLTTFDPGGWDRAEFYADPWTGTMFMTASCIYGNPDDQAGHHVAGANGEAELFRFDGGNWVVAATLPLGAPYVMTSTSGGLWVFTCTYSEGTPNRYHVHPDGTGETGPVQVGSDPCIGQDSTDLYNSTNPVLVIQPKSKGLARHQQFLGPGRDLGIARAPGSDSIRVAFPTVEHPDSSIATLAEKRSVLRLGEASFDASGIHATAGGSPNIKAAKPDASIIMTTFVERNDPEVMGEPTALLYWLESDPDSNSTQVGWALALEGGKLGTVHHLGSHKVRYAFEGGNGDFMNGAYFCEEDGSAEHFIGLFPAGDEELHVGQGTGAAASATSTGETSLRANFHATFPTNGEVGLHMFEVKVSERCHLKGLTPPHPNLNKPSQAAPVTGAIPTVATLGPTPSTTAQPTTTVSTKPATTTTPSTTPPTTPSTTPKPFSVKSISLTLNTCTQLQDGRWNCPGSYTFQFNPGQGGDMQWQTEGTLVPSCNGTSQSFAFPHGVMHVNDNQSSAQGTVSLTFQEAPNPSTVGGSPSTPSVGRIKVTSGGSGSSSNVNFYSNVDCSKP